jgi:serine/threonine-protein kinase HipA
MGKKCLYCYKDLEEQDKGEFHAHCSLEFFGLKTAPQLDYSFDQMAELAKNVVERSVAVPGVQPKISLSLVKEVMADGKNGRLTVVGALGGNYILKPPSDKYPEMPQNEHLTMRIAEAFGISTIPSSLIRLKSGELAYITKRIDRMANGEKIHMLDFFQILEAFDKYKSSMERIGKGIGEYSSDTLLDELYFVELALFCFLTGNNDMHLKNFSMIDTGDGWSLSPAYDLLNAGIINPEDNEELALTLEGKKKKLKKIHFEHLAMGLGLNDMQIKGVFRRFEKNKPETAEWIGRSFLSEEYKEKYTALLNERYLRIYGQDNPINSHDHIDN